MFRKFILSFIFVFCFSGFVFAQTENYTAPVKWERYKISDREVSVLMPKFPVVIIQPDACNEEETYIYAAYAEEVVYTLRITSKKELSGSCRNKRRFSEKNFENRLNELRKSQKDVEESKYNQKDTEVIKFKGKITTYLIFNDSKNKRWFELWTTSNDDTKPETKFAESIQFEKNPEGIEIGEGSPQTIGDFKETPTELLSGSLEKRVVTGIVVVHKAQARYTDKARRENVQGEVVLKVVFMANGGIGKISVVAGLPNGLTEQAIAAAGKIVFIPEKMNGVASSFTKTISYRFTIY